ncbi:ubiquinol-cytochrome C chaperone-domain-containing protein [Peziza echinospora]|nr:ubiquinol-cytochrome C chaperone-domain-containing protein [Peziza echinospora]
MASRTMLSRSLRGLKTAHTPTTLHHHLRCSSALLTQSSAIHTTAALLQNPIPKIPTEPAPSLHDLNAPPESGIITSLARGLRKIAPETTETYRAYGNGKELYLECARQAAYIVPVTEEAKKDAERKGKGKGVAVGVEEEMTMNGEGELSRSAQFWYEECNRPKTFNSWAQVTILHMWAIMVRIRAFPDENIVKIWQQHFIDHFFFDAEEKMQFQYGVKSNPQRSKYLKDLFVQYRGMIAAYDESLARHALSPATPPDPVLATAIWRNVWDARDDVDLKHIAMVTAYVLRILHGLEKMPDEAVMAARLTFGDVRREEEVVLKGPVAAAVEAEMGVGERV